MFSNYAVLLCLPQLCKPDLGSSSQTYLSDLVLFDFALSVLKPGQYLGYKYFHFWLFFFKPSSSNLLPTNLLSSWRMLGWPHIWIQTKDKRMLEQEGKWGYWRILKVRRWIGSVAIYSWQHEKWSGTWEAMKFFKTGSLSFVFSQFKKILEISRVSLKSDFRVKIILEDCDRIGNLDFLADKWTVSTGRADSKENLLFRLVDFFRNHT